MKQFTIKYKMPHSNLDMDSLKFGLLMLGYSFKETIGGDTSVKLGDETVGYLRTSHKRFDIKMPTHEGELTESLLHKAYSLGLITKFGNRHKLKCQMEKLREIIVGVLTDLRTDGVALAFVISSLGSITIQPDSNELSDLVEAIVRPLAEQLGIKPEEEIIRELEV